MPRRKKSRKKHFVASESSGVVGNKCDEIFSQSFDYLYLRCQNREDDYSMGKPSFDFQNYVPHNHGYDITEHGEETPRYFVGQLSQVSDRKYILNVSDYDWTLKEWLEKSTMIVIGNGYRVAPLEVFSVEGGVFTLNEMPRLVIRGILSELCELHYNGRYHGSLDDLDNILLNAHVGTREDQFSVTVSFFYGNMSSSKNIGSTEEGQQKDMWDISSVIFTEIMGVSKEHVPLEWKPLYQNLCPDGNVEKAPQNLSFIADYPSTWFWRRTLDYFELLHTKIEKDLKGALGEMINGLDYQGWKDKIRNDASPFSAVFGDGKTYGPQTRELIRFIRIVINHIHDGDNLGRQLYYNSSLGENWSDERYIELRIRRIFPELLVDIVKALLDDGMGINIACS